MPADVSPLIRAGLPLRRRIAPYAWGLAAVAAASGIAYGLEKILPLPNLSLVFLSAVLLVAMRFGAVPALYAGLLSSAVYNFFFTEPTFTFFVEHEADSLTLAFFLAVAALTGHLAGGVRGQLDSTQQAARRTALLYDFSRKVAAAGDLDEVATAVRQHAAETLGAAASVLLPPPGSSAGPDLSALPAADAEAADRAWRSGVAAGRAAQACPQAERLYMPLLTARGRVGLLGLSFADGRRAVTAEEENLLRAVTDQAAVAVERAQLAAAAENARLITETEGLRTALLSSISHDLRTPLVSVIGSATTLSTVGDVISAEERADLVRTILDEARRLDRFVRNLLDMTRLSHGGLHLRRDWVDLADVVGHALSAARDLLAPFRLKVAVDPAMPLVFADPVLLEQVLVNVLDNAAKYSPPGGRIGVVAAWRDGAAEIRIADDGPGIAEADRERVFDMFYRVRARDSQAAGTGLGLAICRGLISAHGGAIRAEGGTGGVGTEIIVTLPSPPPPGEEDEEGGLV